MIQFLRAINSQPKKSLFLFLSLFLIVSLSCRKGDYYLADKQVITDNGGGTGTVTWSSDKTYLLDGFVFVNDGQILTIEAGTVIQGKTGQGSLSSALIVARGGKIIAEGSSDRSIVFTVEGDDLEGSVPLESSGLWGGLIILGNATVNTPSGESFIEGLPISEPRGVYGGSFDDDNSGILRFVSIRHGGTNIGEGNEINGLTLGGVGRKTTIDHIEVVSNADDGIEFFGGTVNCSNLAAAFCGDDAFDFDEGYSGKCQFLLGILHTSKGDHLAEHNGAAFPGPAKPFSHPEIYNATYVGRFPLEGSSIIRFDQNSGGVYKNSIFMNSLEGVGIEYKTSGSSYDMWMNDELQLSHNIFYQIANEKADSVFRLFPYSSPLLDMQQKLSLYFLSGENEFKDPAFIIQSNSYQLLPPSTVFENMADYSSSWFEQVGHKGAFGSNNWLDGWSYLWKENIIR